MSADPNDIDIHAEIEAKYNELMSEFDGFMNMKCPDMECPSCSKIVCPFNDPMHFHHDGCPSCSEEIER